MFTGNKRNHKEFNATERISQSLSIVYHTLVVCEYQVEREGYPHALIDYDKITEGNMILSLSLKDAKAV